MKFYPRVENRAGPHSPSSLHFEVHECIAASYEHTSTRFYQLVRSKKRFYRACGRPWYRVATHDFETARTQRLRAIEAASQLFHHCCRRSAGAAPIGAMVLGASTGALPAARRFPGGTDGAVSWLETGWVAATRSLGDGGDRETPAAAQGVAPDKNISPGGLGLSNRPRRRLSPSCNALVNGDTETCSIGTAVSAWLADPTAAEQTYGHVSTWDTSQVTNMKRLFCGDPDEWCYPVEKRYFNDDISAWDTSGVTNMYEMFYGSLYFNQPIGDWDVSNVKPWDGCSQKRRGLTKTSAHGIWVPICP